MAAAQQGNFTGFPEKKANVGEVSNAGTAGVLLNGYRLQLDGSVKVVYKHELKFYAKYAGGRERELTRGPKNDVANEQRRKLLWEVFQMLIASDDPFFGNEQDRKFHFVYDSGINFYSIRQLMQRNEERRFELSMDLLSPECQSFIGRRVQGIEARLLAAEQIDLLGKTAIEAGGDRSVVQFLEVLSSQMIISEGKHYVFPQKVYEKANPIQIRDPRVLHSGMQKNVRFLGDDVQTAEPFLQVDPKKAAFFPAVHLGKFLEDLLPPADKHLHEKISSGGNFQMAVKQTKYLVVRTTHLNENANRNFAVHGLTEEGSNQVQIDVLGRKLTVADYFLEKYNISLRFPTLPCVVEQKMARVDGQNRKVNNFFPIEVLQVVAGQRVSLQKQTPTLVEQMIRNCQALPKDFRRLNEEQRGKAFIAAGNPYFKAHGVRPDTDLKLAKAEVLFPPALVYANNDREEPQPPELNWRMQPQRQFLIAAQPPPRWAAVIFQNGVRGHACQEFINKLLQSAKNRGFPLPPPTRYDEWNDTSVEFLRERLQFYKDYNCRFVMFFTRDKLDPVHHTIKYLETQYDLVTQHISGTVMEKGIGTKGAFLVDNVLMKLHLKLGGVNYGLAASEPMVQRNQQLFGNGDVVSKQWLSKDRMFVGIDLSHAGPQSLYERQSGQSVGTPTVVGMAHTSGETVKIRGTYWLQEPRFTIVKDLKEQFKQAVMAFVKENKFPPQSIVIYRNGVSEGEYRKVATEELQQIKQAMEELSEQHSEFRVPPVTIVVAQRASNYRIVPEQVNPQGKPLQQNVPAGTVVDKAIMHPLLTDYLMVGHKTIQGTAHPARYTVLVDENDMSLAELEYATYHLCFTHGIVCSPVSVPGVLYAAGDLAKRGRNNWAQFSEDGKTAGRSRHDGSETYYTERSADLKPTIVHTKFWA